MDLEQACRSLEVGHRDLQGAGIAAEAAEAAEAVEACTGWDFEDNLREAYRKERR